MQVNSKESSRKFGTASRKLETAYRKPITVSLHLGTTSRNPRTASLHPDTISIQLESDSMHPVRTPRVHGTESRMHGIVLQGSFKQSSMYLVTASMKLGTVLMKPLTASNLRI